MSQLRRLWAWWTRHPDESPAPLPHPGVAPHEEWLADLLEELRTPEAEAAFQRTDTLTLLKRPRRRHPPLMSSERTSGMTTTATQQLSTSLSPVMHRHVM